MKYWMYAGKSTGTDDLKALRDAGFTGVIGPASLGEKALHAGLKVMLCGGAFPAGSQNGPDHLALDINGKRQMWFGSCCPSHLPTRQKNLALYRSMAQTPGITGILIDGARFSSPASSEDPDSFFTCFCPRCRGEMARLGLDADRIVHNVKELYGWLFEGGARPHDWTGVKDWLSFRAQTAGSHVKDFARVIHQVPGLQAGAFFFSPSLAAMVGQSYAGQSETLDLISPMLYPAYPAAPGDPGTACLNQELAALARMLCQKGAMDAKEAWEWLSGLMGGAELPQPSQLAREVPRTLIGSETRRAIREGAPARILPILQLDDPLLGESICGAIAAGAEEMAFFAYNPQAFSKMGLLP